MRLLKFTDGFAVQDFTGLGVDYTISAFTDAFKSVDRSIVKNIQEINIKSAEAQYIVNKPTANFAASLQRGAYFLNATDVKSVSYLNSDELFRVSNFISGNSNTAINIRIVQNLSKEIRSIPSVMINESNLEGDSVDMNQKLINHRNNIEKHGINIGFIFGVASLLPSLLLHVDWAATVPASILFFSIPTFVLMRRQLRGDHD